MQPDDTQSCLKGYPTQGCGEELLGSTQLGMLALSAAHVSVANKVTDCVVLALLPSYGLFILQEALQRRTGGRP